MAELKHFAEWCLNESAFCDADWQRCMPPDRYIAAKKLIFGTQAKIAILLQSIFYHSIRTNTRLEVIEKYGDKSEEGCKDWEDFFRFQEIDRDKLRPVIKDWLMCRNGRRNVLYIYGAPGTGKTTFLKLLTKMFHTCYISAVNPKGDFLFEGCVNKRLIAWEEPLIPPALAQECKKLFSGDPIDVHVKFCPPQTLNKTPIIMTSNDWKFERGYLSSIDEQALDQRRTLLKFDKVWDGRVTLTTAGLRSFILK